MIPPVKLNRRRGWTRISSKHQVTIPLDALARAGLRTGDRLRAEVRISGEVVLVRDVDPLDRFSGALTGVYPSDYLGGVRREWE